MLKLSLLLLFASISTFSFSQKRPDIFEIIGNVSGFQNGTCIKLYKDSNGVGIPIESTKIINGKFTFRGAISKDYQLVSIITCDMKNMCNFWIENSVIRFNAQKGKFRNAKITGSSIQNEASQLDSIKQQNPKQEKAKIIAFIRNHPNSIISGYNLKHYSMVFGKDTTKLLYNGLSEKVKQSDFGKGIHEYLTLNRTIKIGDKYVNFTLPDIHGKMVSLSDYKGKYVLLDFWGSWCTPCIEENPTLEKIYKAFKGRGFEILGVSTETKKKSWLNAIRLGHITWVNVSDLKGNKNKAALIYGIDRYPSNFLINPNGIIIAKNLTVDELRIKLTKILK